MFLIIFRWIGCELLACMKWIFRLRYWVDLVNTLKLPCCCLPNNRDRTDTSLLLSARCAVHSAGWQLGREFQRISLLGPGILDIALSVMVFNVKFIQSISSRRNLFLANNTGFQNFVFVEFNFLSGSRVRVPPLSCLEKSVACKLRHLYCEKVEQVLTRLVYIQSEVKLSQNYKSPTVHCYAFIHYILTISDYLSCTSFPASR